MIDSMAMGAGMAGGGLLGQIGDTLSAPRRALWDLVGLPQSGTELLSQTFGMDPDSLLTKALGVGAEMTLDPLTYAGGPLLNAGSKLAGALAGGGELAGEIAALNSARRAAQEALVERAAMEEANVAGQAERFAGMRNQVDVPGIADAEQRLYTSASPEARGALDESGLGMGNGDLSAYLYGERKPAGLGIGHGGAIAGRPGGSFLDVAANGGNMPELTPYERYLIMSKGAEAGGGKALRSIHSPDVLGDVAAQRGAEMNAALPTPTLGEAMGRQFMPKADIARIQGMGLGDLDLNQGFDTAQSLLAKALQTKAAQQLSPQDLLALAGGAGGGAFAGGLAGFNRRENP